ncbi:hypothetical protein EVAR_27140_1 [Eumeta japonica]|uniref:Uncharacterized protein n=1 Tax=Eumeta variegata TaxID=151549 RepID=A0A4C1W089_EUMVA|nr:hypothetical protein EVAR_27140_1 [Eumeta japonica]
MRADLCAPAQSVRRAGARDLNYETLYTVELLIQPKARTQRGAAGRPDLRDAHILALHYVVLSSALPVKLNSFPRRGEKTGFYELVHFAYSMNCDDLSPSKRIVVMRVCVKFYLRDCRTMSPFFSYGSGGSALSCSRRPSARAGVVNGRRRRDDTGGCACSPRHEASALT